MAAPFGLPQTLNVQEDSGKQIVMVSVGVAIGTSVRRFEQRVRCSVFASRVSNSPPAAAGCDHSG
ncbi:MAG: hypothetical protein NTU53_11815 [Planctomycetota bacterium]|nr:hypothetical protein [Planctomycetota bacterium]